ncbi:rhodanese-like domain-containing protein [Colwellia piezophila]|uniref:rhodanese-like domain-containing protein n=1 Tax=Colwellia piezophila TaxID=211668 RepID=UPI00035F0D41|nr:rhodanese-like domain-containing protein [Colwellia piezophila]
MKTIFVVKIAPMVLLALALIASAQVSAEDISQAQLQQVMQSNKQVILLDVRTVEEFTDGHIPNAVNIPHKELESRLAELSGAKNTQIVLYCRSGRRVEIATKLLKQHGFNQLDHLTGDFNAWSSNNLPITQSKPK